MVRSYTCQSGTFFHRWIDRAILVGRAVVVAEGDQGANLKLQILRRLGMVVLFQFVVNDGAIFAVNHEYGFLDLDAFDFIREDRKRVEAELLQMAKALWMNHTRIPIR